MRAVTSKANYLLSDTDENIPDFCQDYSFLSVVHSQFKHINYEMMLLILLRPTFKFVIGTCDQLCR